MSSTSLGAVDRRVRDACTRFTRAVGFVARGKESASNAQVRWLHGYQAEQLLRAALDDADVLVRLLNDEDWDRDLERKAHELYLMLRARRLSATLAQIEGRTPAEAAAFTAKARELRES